MYLRIIITLIQVIKYERLLLSEATLPTLNLYSINKIPVRAHLEILELKYQIWLII